MRIDQRAKIQEPIHWKPRIRYESIRFGIWHSHPGRQQHQCTVGLAHDKMKFAAVVFAAVHCHLAPASRMEWVVDQHLKLQTPGIVTLVQAAPAKRI